MNTQEMVYRLALNAIKGIGPVKAKKIIDYLGDSSRFFQVGRKFLKHELALSDAVIDEVLAFRSFSIWEKEVDILSQNGVQILCHDTSNYPELLKQCADSPAVLFVQGDPQFLQRTCIAVIGTRHHTEYGKRRADEFIQELAEHPLCIISGLAFGIDGIAHRAALRNGLPTFGVLAHGLRDLYPPAHRALSRDMQAQGGLISEYSYFTKANREYFPARNRIVAGMCSATIIIETDIRGGSMITAELAYSYNREVFCFPGRSDDRKSAGCNHLIKNLKAQLITSADDVVEALGWKEKPKKLIQRSLFNDFTDDEQAVLKQLQLNAPLHYDVLSAHCSMHTSTLSNTLLQLELKGMVLMKPGKLIDLV